MNGSYRKDVWRTIVKSKKRYVSMMIISALGVTMLTGLKAGCVDLRLSADQFYDESKLYDIQVLSTLGLDQTDVEALSNLEGVHAAVGSNQETAYIQVNDHQETIELRALNEQGINEPYVWKGVLPKQKQEIAVSEKYCKHSGKQIGDKLMLDVKDKDSTNLKQQEFWITAIMLDPTNISVDEGAASFRSTSSVDDVFFVSPEAIEQDIYTSIYLILSDTSELQSYSDTYKEKVREIIKQIEVQIKSSRETERTNNVVSKAWQEYQDAYDTVEKEIDQGDLRFQEAKQQLTNGFEQVQNGLSELSYHETLLEEKHEELEAGIQDGYLQIEEGLRTYLNTKEQMQSHQQQLLETRSQLDEALIDLKQQESHAKQKLDQQQDQIKYNLTAMDIAHAQFEIELSAMKTSVSILWPEQEWKMLYDQAVASYLPIAYGNLQIQQLQQSDDIDEQQFAQLQQHLRDLQQSVSQNFEQQENIFRLVLSNELSSIHSHLEELLEALDPARDDYEEVKQSYLTKQQQLQVIPDQAIALAIQGAKIKANQMVALETLETLNEQQNIADEQFSKARTTLQQQEVTWNQHWNELEAGMQQLEEGYEILIESSHELELQQRMAESELTEASQQLDIGKVELLKQEEQLIDAQNVLKEQRTIFEQKKKDAIEELHAAKSDIEAIEPAKWYVQDRGSISSYASIQSDASSIEAVGTAFPIVFLAVAVLISLTTITRLVEEERSLIGTYKALGFSDTAIYSKYLIYAVSASFIGGIIGDICGFILLPKFLFTIFQVLYKLPDYQLSFDPVYGIGGILIFVIGIAIAALLACRVELKQLPSILMRPKAPRAGSRVILESFTGIWRRLTFLNKVTARNLFRYKKRMCMTIAGIMGCTALVLCGFAIKDSVTELMPGQYERIYQYDFMGVVLDDAYEVIEDELKQDTRLSNQIGIRIDSIKVSVDQKQEEMQLMVIPEGTSLKGYIGLYDIEGNSLALEDGIYITQNASQVLGFEKYDKILIQDQNLVEQEVEVKEIVQNYLGNSIYMTQNMYESLFGTMKPNGFLVHFEEGIDQVQFTQDFQTKEDVLSSVSVPKLKSEFTDAFSLINAVVYLITFMAAGLAFVVLFTLSTTNISERERELATIKVLGFFDQEVHLYVHKETVILTLLGILCGLPLGRWLSGLLTSALRMPSIHFAVNVYPISYVYAALLSLCFALIVNFMTNRTLNQIDMVEALKSME